MTTALITGASGFVGPYLTQHLAESGDDVVCVSRTTGGPDLLDSKMWCDLVGDHQPDIIYHLAGFSDVGASWDDPKAAFSANANGTQSVLEAVRVTKPGTRVVFVSSSDVYGTVPSADLPITENTPTRPNSPYGASKVAAEQLARQYCRGFSTPVVIARPFNHIGPGQSTRFAAPSFAKRIVDCEAAGGGVVTHGDLSARRDFTDVRDVVQAYRLLGTDGVPGETYNICSGVDIEMSELLALLVNQATVPVETRINPELMRPVELPALRGSFARLQAATGWKPTIPLSQTLTDILADARKQSTPGASS